MTISRELDRRILILDGAMGTCIQAKHNRQCPCGCNDSANEELVLTHPDLIAGIHEDYLRAGADVIETNTFGGTPLVLAEFGLSEKANELNLAAARLARGLADKYSSTDKPRFVAGSMGPTTKSLSLTGGVTFTELQRNFAAQARALLEGGVDYLLLETCQDTLNTKAALTALDELFASGARRVPIAVSVTLEPGGTMLAGQSVEALIASLAHRELLYLGLNCGSGAQLMTDAIRTLARRSPFRVSCLPNAGLPNEDGRYTEEPRDTAAILTGFVREGWINVLGGCCGTTPAHIGAIHEMVRTSGAAPRVPAPLQASCLSGIDYLEIDDAHRPVLVGERTNVIGSRKFKTLIMEKKLDEASDIARAQSRSGAQIIDVCLSNPDSNELEDMRSFMAVAAKKIRAPIMIDSTNDQVIAAALTYCQGKSIINSVNLENGEGRFQKILPLARQHGAAVVVGTIDDHPTQGMAVTRQRKLEIAEREYGLITGKYGIPEQDIYFDPLVFPCSTGDAQYLGSALETVEGLRLIKQRFPRCRTVLGISNVSFGLPPAGREILNSVFLHHCVLAGLDLAIVNAEKLVRFPTISPEERRLAKNLLFHPEIQDAAAQFVSYFREKKPAAPTRTTSQASVHDRLVQYVLEGTKDGLPETLDEALQKHTALELINGPLMEGMERVGKLFNTNELIIAEVLQSAEVMKAAVTHLQPHLSSAESRSRGTVLLATVKGDVHDIGKNLVEIILSNNGFRVIDLGLKVTSDQVIRGVQEHRPDILGWSGLLVKSAHEMAAMAEDLSNAGIQLPLLVGGAALTENFVNKQIAPRYSGIVAYAKDAMRGLALAQELAGKTQKKALQATPQATPHVTSHVTSHANSEERDVPPAQSVTRPLALSELPKAPDFERHVVHELPLERIMSFLNTKQILSRHLGAKPNRHEEIEKQFEDVKQQALRSDWLRPRAVYSFFPASSRGDEICLFNPQMESLGSWRFPRQPGRGKSLADYVHPEMPTRDSLALFVVTAGSEPMQYAQKLKNQGELLHSHLVQSLAIGITEACAEYLHAEIRRLWGFPDSPSLDRKARQAAKYRGKRYSFGYPACPELADQRTLFSLLRPEEIGVRLTDGFMMEPEASLSALVFHHPEAEYFSV